MRIFRSSHLTHRSKWRSNATPPVSASSLTVPDYLTRALPQGQGILVVGSYTMPAAITAAGLDVARVRAGSATTLQVNLQTPPVN